MHPLLSWNHFELASDRLICGESIVSAIKTELWINKIKERQAIRLSKKRSEQSLKVLRYDVKLPLWASFYMLAMNTEVETRYIKERQAIDLSRKREKEIWKVLQYYISRPNWASQYLLT
jgi:hypothetical protein